MDYIQVQGRVLQHAVLVDYEPHRRRALVLEEGLVVLDRRLARLVRAVARRVQVPAHVDAAGDVGGVVGVDDAECYVELGLAISGLVRGYKSRRSPFGFWGLGGSASW